MRSLRLSSLLLLFAAAATAQQRPIFDVDDVVDPAQHGGAVFASRLIAGGVAGLIDDYRPLRQAAGFVHLTNSYYRGRFQFDFKHSEVRSEDSGTVHRQVCAQCREPIYFPTAPLPDETPEAPPPGRKETFQVGWYHGRRSGLGEPITLRYRLTVAQQPIDTVVTALDTERVVARLSGRERSIGVEGDVYLPIAGREIFGTVYVARTSRNGTTDNRAQNEIVYTNRFPNFGYRGVLVRALLTVGGVSGRGAGGVNVVNPQFEAMWHNARTGANLHFAWSPQATRSGAGGWEMRHQIALFADRALYVKLFR